MILFFWFQENWSSFADRLKKLETELHEHHAAVGEIRNAVNRMIEKDNNEVVQQRPQPERHHPKALHLNNLIEQTKKNPFIMAQQCPADIHKINNVDVQV